MIEKNRKTKETDITLALDIYGAGDAEVSTGIGFFDHMLETLAKHALFDLKLTCKGDLAVDFHHSVEDCGILLGAALNEAIYPAVGIERFADRTAVLDESAVKCALDLGGRGFLNFAFKVEGKVGEFDSELAEEFFRAIAINAKIAAHFYLLSGENRHHIIEAAFKAFALAMRAALTKNDRVRGAPSAKGVL
ncbi:MAG: imidazoleglycerol-phosphate dehydratase HisB [Helicobacteraceae bacterium]|jgi:imidazoleglycerol-phosphate dehydratase|nr:imidazoleglycerol-phosphate dehydratase HisB [Helicobacteraceae bacterium]